MKDFSISPALEKDIPGIIDYQVKMAKETEELELAQKTVRAGVEAVFKDRGKGTYYVVKYQDQLVGCLLTTFEWSEWRNGTVLWIQSVYIKEDFRKRGLFKALYEYLKEKVTKDDQLKGMRLYVDKSNKRAQEVYEKIGMDGQHYQLFEWIK